MNQSMSILFIISIVFSQSLYAGMFAPRAYSVKTYRPQSEMITTRSTQSIVEKIDLAFLNFNILIAHYQRLMSTRSQQQSQVQGCRASGQNLEMVNNQALICTITNNFARNIRIEAKVFGEISYQSQCIRSYDLIFDIDNGRSSPENVTNNIDYIKINFCLEYRSNNYFLTSLLSTRVGSDPSIIFNRVEEKMIEKINDFASALKNILNDSNVL